MSDWDGLAEAATTVEEQAAVLALIRTELAHLKDLDAELSAQIAAVVAEQPERQLAIDGLGTIEARWASGYRKWDNQSLLGAVTRHALEQRGDRSELEAVVDAITTTWRFDKPRTTPLKEWGIDPDEYSERTRPGLWRIVIRTVEG